MSKNDITGDKIQTKPSTKYADNFDKIFRNKPSLEWDEQRIDIIGQNGNDGLHYKQTKPKK